MYTTHSSRHDCWPTLPERGSRLGEEVGFAALFGQNYDENKTSIKYMTDDHLIREMMVDPLLSKYQYVWMRHERNVFTDVIFGLLRKIREKTGLETCDLFGNDRGRNICEVFRERKKKIKVRV